MRRRVFPLFNVSKALQHFGDFCGQAAIVDIVLVSKPVSHTFKIDPHKPLSREHDDCSLPRLGKALLRVIGLEGAQSHLKVGSLA